MVGLTNYSADNELAYIVGKTAMPALPTAYVALFTAVGTDAGTGFTEAAFTGYARVATSGATWNAPSGTSPSTITSAATVTFGTCTASAGANIIAWGLYDALTGGNLLAWDYIYAGGSGSSGAWSPFTCSTASPGVITSPAHGLSNGNTIVVTAEYGGALPATSGSWSGLLTVANVTTDTFTAGVNTTGTGDGLWRQVVSQAMVVNLALSFPAGDLVLSAA